MGPGMKKEDLKKLGIDFGFRAPTREEAVRTKKEQDRLLEEKKNEEKPVKSLEREITSSVVEKAKIEEPVKTTKKTAKRRIKDAVATAKKKVSKKKKRG